MNYKLGIIGKPIKHSLSPMIHNFWLDEYKLKGRYDRFLVEENNLGTFLKDLRYSRMKGLNVTIPYKEKILPYLDKIDITAKKLEAVNTIVREKEKYVGYNTDITGFLLGMQEKVNYWDKTRPVLVVGAGGAAKAIINALINQKIKEIRIMNRTETKIDSLCKKYKQLVKVQWMDSKSLLNIGLLVNTSSLGMLGFPTIKIDFSSINSRPIIYDIVYNPLETTLIKEAKKLNLIFIDGLDMLLGQARESFNHWFSIYPEVSSVLKTSLLKALIKK